jgi:uncharacterized membrane protein
MMGKVFLLSILFASVKLETRTDLSPSCYSFLFKVLFDKFGSFFVILVIIFVVNHVELQVSYHLGSLGF